jgi:hypothetical protein
VFNHHQKNETENAEIFPTNEKHINWTRGSDRLNLNDTLDSRHHYNCRDLLCRRSRDSCSCEPNSRKIRKSLKVGNTNQHISHWPGTFGGTLTFFLASITGELIKTIVLTAVGAAVSFSVSFLLKCLVERWRKFRA